MTHRLTEGLRRLAFENHDVCTACGYKFREGDTSHLGYSADETPLYVCDKCSVQLKETAARHYFSPRPYEVPEPTSNLWRYMDFTKYVNVLSSQSVYFTRADCLEDKFEGAKGLRSYKAQWDSYYLDFFRSAIRNPPEGHTCDLSDAEVDEQATRLLRELEEGGEAWRRWTYVNCWHESEYESEAMWRLYSSYLASAVAVRTTYHRLYTSLGRNPSIHIGRIQYIDLKKNYVGVNDAFWRKRSSFEHEREVRALLVDFEHEELGRSIPCDLQVLVEAVYVSPKAPDWFVRLVNDVNEKFGLDVTVSTSDLLGEPFF